MAFTAVASATLFSGSGGSTSIRRQPTCSLRLLFNGAGPLYKDIDWEENYMKTLITSLAKDRKKLSASDIVFLLALAASSFPLLLR